MSAISTFKRCGKKFDIQYRKLLDGVRESPAMELGTNFHKIMEEYAKTGNMGESVLGDIEHVACDYVHYNGFPNRDSIISAEDPLYIEVLPEVYVRCTMDLVYKKDDYIVIRDYKTFSKSPTLDIELDFQARVYIALLMKHFKTDKVSFEHVYVRTTPPNVPKDKAGKCWEPSECYITDTLVVGEEEAAVIMGELQSDLLILEYCEKTDAYTRNNIKGGGYMDCNRCSVKELCKAELQHGSLDLIDLTYLAVKREPIELPEALL